MLICLLVVVSVISLVVTIIIIKKIKKKKLANLMYQNCGVHAENTERDSPPFQEYVGISRDIIYVYTCICILFPHSFVLYVCMYAYVSV